MRPTFGRECIKSEFQRIGEGSLECVNDEMETELLNACHEVRKEFKARDVTWRNAAYLVVLSLIADARETRRLWP